MIAIKLKSEKKELKAGDTLGYLYGGEGEPVQMKVTQTAIDTLERLEKEHNLDLIDDRIVCSTSPREVQMIMNFQKEKEQYAQERVLEELEHIWKTPYTREKDRYENIYNRLVRRMNEIKEVKQ
jgi:hypothetical protein